MVGIKQTHSRHSMFNIVDKNTLKKPSNVFMIKEGKIKKPKAKNCKGKPTLGKGKRKSYPEAQQLKKKVGVAKKDECIECGLVGH